MPELDWVIEEAKERLNFEWIKFGELKNATLASYGKKIPDVWSILHHLLLLSNLEGVPPLRQSEYETSVIYRENLLIVLEWQNFMADLLIGAYWGASRTLRWILESTLKAYVATVDRSILDNDPTHKGTEMTSDQFNKYLVYADQNPYNVIGIKGILKNLVKIHKITDTENSQIYDTYCALCKHVHFSTTSYQRIEDRNYDTVINLSNKDFSKAYNLMIRTIDPVLYFICDGYVHLFNYDQEIKGFFDGYRDLFVDRDKKFEQPFRLCEKQFPITVSFLDRMVSMSWRRS